jgi:hypothetical protein
MTKADGDPSRGVLDEYSHHLLPLRSQRHANSNLVTPPRHNVGNHTVEAQHGEYHGQESEDAR